MMAAASEQKVRLRQQASVEAEVSRSRLALAHTDLEAGNTELAMRRAVEAAFDAGVAHGYAQQSKQRGFNKETKNLLAQSQAIAKVAGAQKVCDGAYKVGMKYAKARCGNGETAVQEALDEYQVLIEEVGVGRMANPGPPPRRAKKIPTVRALKSRLLR
jgi:hypothetical protein